MDEQTKAHIAVELKFANIEVTDNNIKGFIETRFNLADVKEQISIWLECVGTNDDELQEIENLDNFEFKYMKEFDSWIVIFGNDREYILVQNTSLMQDKFEEDIEPLTNTDFYENYVQIDGNYEIFLVQNDYLLLQSYKITDFYDLFRSTGVVTSDQAIDLSELADQEVEKILKNKEHELKLKNKLELNKK